MGVRMSVRMLSLGTTIAAVAIMMVATPSGAGVPSTCTATTQTFVQTVGLPSAPVVVPMNLPVQVCSLSGNVQVIVPAFQLVGGRGATVIVPRGIQVVSCTPSVVTISSTTLTTVPVLQATQPSGSTVLVLSTVPAAAVAPAVTCF